MDRRRVVAPNFAASHNGKKARLMSSAASRSDHDDPIGDIEEYEVSWKVS